MNKFSIQIERINKIQSPLPISIDKTLFILNLFFNRLLWEDLLKYYKEILYFCLFI